MFQKKPKVVTHDGPFHVDEVFAVAALDFLLNGHYKLVRTRDPEVIKKGDYVVDVGGVYDRERNLFDHHQPGGAGSRDGIPYSSLGLVWEKYGEEVCGSSQVSEIIKQEFVYGEDALDCGVDIIPKNELGVHVFRMYDVIESFRPRWNENKTFDTGFYEALTFAKDLLRRQIKKAQSSLEAEEKVIEAYEKAEDKRTVILERYYPNNSILRDYPEPLYIVHPYSGSDHWVARAVRAKKESFENRKDFPESWAGKTGEELAQISGVKDALFCHNARWICSAKSCEGAVALATIAADA